MSERQIRMRVIAIEYEPEGNLAQVEVLGHQGQTKGALQIPAGNYQPGDFIEATLTPNVPNAPGSEVSRAS